MIKGCQQYDWQPVWASLPEPLHPPVLTGVIEAGLVHFSYTSSQQSLANLREFPFPRPASQRDQPCLSGHFFFETLFRHKGRVCCYMQQPFVWAKQRESRVVKWSDATANCIHRILHGGNAKISKGETKNHKRLEACFDSVPGCRQQCACAQTFTHWTTFLWLISNYGDDSHSTILNFVHKNIRGLFLDILVMQRCTKKIIWKWQDKSEPPTIWA